MFRLCRSVSNIVSKCHIREDASLRVKRLNSSYIPERVKYFWNHLPVSVKNSAYVDIFKSNLESFKQGCIDINDIDINEDNF